MELFFKVLFYTFIGVTTINVAFYLFYKLFAFAKVKPSLLKDFPPVSVIICSKNEAKNLKEKIPKIISQRYPLFEIILINDASSDETGDVIEAFALDNKNIEQVQVVNNETFWGNKKYALTLGVKKAKYEHFLFIDADCVPASDEWLKEMGSMFVGNKELVLGYGSYEKIKGSWLNKLIRFETLMTAIQYFSWASSGKAYMGVGRNLAYTSELFYEQKGFIGHMNVLSGDDDLFVSQAATRKNVAVQYAPESFTISIPKKTVASWIRQKRRHISTAKHYKNIHKFFLGLFYSSQLFFFLLFIPLLVSQFMWEYVLIVVGVRYLFSWIIVGSSASQLREKDLIAFYPIHEVVLICIQLSIFMINQISKPTRWK